LVEILRKINYNNTQGENYGAKIGKEAQCMSKNLKCTKELGVGKDGYQTGGVTIEATNPQETQTVTVRGTKAMRADKKPVKATWY
jgi:hypothetical protein